MIPSVPVACMITKPPMHDPWDGSPNISLLMISLTGWTFVLDKQWGFDEFYMEK